MTPEQEAKLKSALQQFARQLSTGYELKPAPTDDPEVNYEFDRQLFGLTDMLAPWAQAGAPTQALYRQCVEKAYPLKVAS